mmetsp:Transcript_15597/g.46736  ORF Transcript_15597/g.46736 Transcript_15597/m.46736 type:complete len:87 (-) Transcript_15597:555-815(-)
MPPADDHPPFPESVLGDVVACRWGGGSGGGGGGGDVDDAPLGGRDAPCCRAHRQPKRPVRGGGRVAPLPVASASVFACSGVCAFER